jgi:flagellar basal body rod protein FlgC
MDVSAIALQGLDQASAQLDAAASRLANVGTTSPDGASLDTVSLSDEMVALMSARTLFAANLATLKTADQIQKSTIDLMA